MRGLNTGASPISRFSTADFRLSTISLRGTPPKARNALMWQPRKCSIVCDTVNSRYIMRLCASTITKNDSRRRVLPTAMVPYSPQSTWAHSPGANCSFRYTGLRPGRTRATWRFSCVRPPV